MRTMHGSGDDNVHYHLGAERLVNALVQANKLFTFQPYPNRTHGIAEGENTSLHVREVMTKFLEDHMPPGPNPVSSSAPPAPSPPFP